MVFQNLFHMNCDSKLKNLAQPQELFSLMSITQYHRTPYSNPPLNLLRTVNNFELDSQVLRYVCAILFLHIYVHLAYTYKVYIFIGIYIVFFCIYIIYIYFCKISLSSPHQGERGRHSKAMQAEWRPQLLTNTCVYMSIQFISYNEYICISVYIYILV